MGTAKARTIPPVKIYAIRINIDFKMPKFRFLSFVGLKIIYFYLEKVRIREFLWQDTKKV